MHPSVILRREQPTLIVAFPSTADAMLMEKLCREQNVPGRLVPLPPQISAGCGMSWSAPPEAKARIEELIHTSNVRVESINIIDM